MSKNLLTPTASLFNNIMANSQHPVPEVGMGATILFYTDRKAATVIEVSVSGKQIVVCEDKAVRIDNNGMSEVQEYRYEAGSTVYTEVFTLRRNGRWVVEGENLHTGRSLILGVRNHYHDYNF